MFIGANFVLALGLMGGGNTDPIALFLSVMNTASQQVPPPGPCGMPSYFGEFSGGAMYYVKCSCGASTTDTLSNIDSWKDIHKGPACCTEWGKGPTKPPVISEAIEPPVW